MRSRTPPKPGRVSEASFWEQSRLIMDSMRSPSWATTPTTRPKPMVARNGQRPVCPGSGAAMAMTSCAARTAKSMPPTAPSIGLVWAEAGPELVTSEDAPAGVGADVGPLGDGDEWSATATSAFARAAEPA